MAWHTDCSKSLAAGVFKGGGSLMNSSPPKQTISSTRFEILWLDIAPMKIALKRVFVAFLWMTQVSFSRGQLTIIMSDLMACNVPPPQ